MFWGPSVITQAKHNSIYNTGLVLSSLDVVIHYPFTIIYLYLLSIYSNYAGAVTNNIGYTLTLKEFMVCIQTKSIAVYTLYFKIIYSL